MNEIKLSIIVPVCNAEKTLKRCVNSILRNIIEESEIILIDDGSKDNSVRICDDYAEKDTRIKVIHKKNGGVSSARNAGLDVASGKYLMFVDSDDEMVGIPNLKGEFDLLFGGVEIVNNEPKVSGCENIIKTIGETAKEENSYGLNFIEENLTHQLIRTPWAKVYNRTIIDENSIRFSEDMRFGEDTVFNLRYFNYCRLIRTNKNVLYKYYPSTGDFEKYKMKVLDSIFHMSKINNAALGSGLRNDKFYKSNFWIFKCLCEYDMPQNYTLWFKNPEVKLFWDMIKGQFPAKYRLKYTVYPLYYKYFYSTCHKLRNYFKGI